MGENVIIGFSDLKKEKENKEDIVEEFDIWDTGNEIVLRAYQGDNYQCIDTGVKSDFCYIFFSSNGLYYPNTKRVFEEQILEKDRYEWKWVVNRSQVPQCAGRIIYIRDIYKEWYSKGINSRINTIDKLLDLLTELTMGWKVVTVGSSAGGYMAVLSAIKLEAEYCLNFSGQYCISSELQNPYYDLTKILTGYRGHIFYFCPFKCEADRKDYQRVQNIECVKTFLFNDTKHASTMFTGNMSYIIGRSEADLFALYRKNRGKEINKIIFLLQTVPVKAVFSIMWKEIKGFIIRRTGRHWNGV